VTPRLTSFYDDTQRYDQVTAALSGDGPVDFYRRHAVRYGSPVLELACGSGRLSIPIAREGLDVVGLDASTAMLALAETKARAAGVTIEWVPGDICRFDLGRRFNSIFVASNSFSHLFSRADIEGCLDCVRQHLTASGIFVIEVFNPAPGIFVRPAELRFPVAEYEDVRTGRRMAVSKTARYDSATQIIHEMWYFRDEVSGEEHAVPLDMRMFFPAEIDALLHYNGFRIEAKFGDHEKVPFCDSSRKQIIVASVAG
jgi:SAM-dependent methyltransferase